MRAMVLHRFAPAGAGMRLEEVPVPRPAPREVLVRVHASSVNPIDVRRSNGYGRNFFAAVGGVRLPMILGRDLAGVVEAAGEGAPRFKPGDAVWGALGTRQDGSFAEYVAVPEAILRPKPAGLSFEEAASIPYVALTSWAALVENCGLTAETARGKRILVLGGAGGCGSFAVQWLKAWGAWVAATCSTGNVEFVAGLGADRVIDHTREDVTRALRDIDIVYDTVGLRPERRSLGVLKRHAGAHFVTIVHGRMPITDRFGYRLGERLAAALHDGRIAWYRAARGAGYHWSYFFPAPEAFATIATLVEAGRIRPVVTRRFPLDGLEAAFRQSAGGHTRGKIAIRIAA